MSGHPGTKNQNFSLEVEAFMWLTMFRYLYLVLQMSIAVSISRQVKLLMNSTMSAPLPLASVLQIYGFFYGFFFYKDEVGTPNPPVSFRTY